METEVFLSKEELYTRIKKKKNGVLGTHGVSIILQLSIVSILQLSIVCRDKVTIDVPFSTEKKKNSKLKFKLCIKYIQIYIVFEIYLYYALLSIVFYISSPYLVLIVLLIKSAFKNLFVRIEISQNFDQVLFFYLNDKYFLSSCDAN